MNKVELAGILYRKAVPRATSAGIEVWIWLAVDGQWLPVLCRGATAAVVSLCSSGAQVELQGVLEYVESEPGSWFLRVIATQIQSYPVRWPTTGEQRRKPKSTYRDEPDEESYYDLGADFLEEISPGLYWDPINEEYRGNPDGDDYSRDDDSCDHDGFAAG